eukprot:g12031.t1
MAPSNVVSLASPEDVPGVMTRGSGCTAAQQPPPRAQENPLQNAAVVQATAAANASSFSADAVETAMRKMPMTRTRPEMTSMPGARVYMANRLETPGFGTRGTKAEDNVDVNKTPLACGIGVKVGESGASSSSASMATSSELPSASANNYTPTSKNKDKVVAGAAAGIITKNGLSFPLQNQGGVPFPNGANGSDVDGASSSAAAAAGAAAASLPHIEIIRASKQSIERYLKWEKDNARFLTHKLRDQEARYKTLEEAERAREELRVNLFRFLDPELPQRVDLCKEVQRQFNALAVECSRARAEATRVRELLSESHALYREQENEMSTLRDTFDKQTSIWEQKAVSLATVNSALQAKIDAILAEKQGEMEAKEEQRKTMVEEHRLEVERVTASLNDQIELSKKAFFDEQNANIEKRTQEELKMRNALGEKEGEKLKLLQRIEEKEREIGLLREMVEGEKESYGEKVSEYVVERDALSGELRELKELTEGLEKKNAELELAAENGRKAMELADAERKMLGEDRTRMEAQMRLLEERLAKIEKERLEVEDKLTSLESERATQSKREEDHVRKFADTVTELEQTRVSAAEMKIAEVSHLDQIRAMGSEIEGLTNDKAELQRDFAEFKDAKEKNIADLTVSVNNTERTNEELKELLAKMRLLNNDVTGTLKDRENEIERLKQELDDSRLESKELNAYSKQQAAATARLRGDNLTAQEEFKKAEENLKAEMEATKAGHAEQTSKMREEARKRTEDYAEKIDSLEIEIEKQSALLMKKGEAHLEAQRTWEQAQEKLLGERDAAKAQAERNLAWKQDYEVTRQQLQVAEQQLEDTRSLLAERARTDQMRKSAIGALLQTVQMDQMVGAGSSYNNTNVLSASRATSSGELATVDIFAQQQLGGHLHAQVYASPTSPQMRFADQRHLKPLPQAAQRYAQMNHGDGGAGSTTAAIPGHLHHYSPSGGGRPSFDSIQQHQRQPRAGLSPARTQEAGVHDPGSYHRPRAQTYDQVQQDETYDRNISKAISEAETIITYRGVEHNSSSSAQHLPARGPPQGGQGHDLTSDMEDAPPRRVSTSNLLSGNSATGGVDTALLTKLRQERRESIERAIREQQGIFNGAPLEPPGSFLDWFTG